MKTKRKDLTVLQSLLPFIVVIVFGLLSVMRWKVGMNMPIILGIVTACIIGFLNGKAWSELQKGLVDGVARGLPALFILIIIGAIMGSWIQGGIISTLIYYGLKLISPGFFVPAACLVTAIVAVSTGTSFTSIATVGIALMVTGIGMGFSPPLLAGAIISGAYFGDCISPLSDTPNLASAITGVNLFDLIKSLAMAEIPALFISLIVFFFLGNREVTSTTGNLETINSIINGLESSFVTSPFLLLIPVLTIVLSAKKVPSLPALFIVAILGGLAGIFVQGESPMAVFNAMTNGFVSESGNELIDSLLSRGGINSMGNTVILLIIAVGFGGILEEIGALDSILNVIMKRINSTGSLVLVTILSGLFVAFATGAQLLALLFRISFLCHPAAQSTGAIAINLVLWSVPALFAQQVLGISAIEFIPFIIFAYATLVINIIYGFTGFTIKKEEVLNERI